MAMINERTTNVADSAHPQAAYLKNKSWYLEHKFPDERFADTDCFIAQAAQLFKRMMPFNDYLNTALNGSRCRNDNEGNS